jgi:poly(3-hydroxybutyrate) depolymerase
VPSPASLTTLSCSDAANSGKGLIGEFTDQCNNRYTVYCGRDTTPGQSDSTSAANINDCMLKCDAFPKCSAAVLVGNTCYFKTSFVGLVTTDVGANTAALVRFVPPNPKYVAPVAASGGGCGKALPSNITTNGPSAQFGTTPSDGIPRTYLVHIPQYYDINKASPIIFGFHGNRGTAEGIQDQTGFNDASLNPYAIAVYVQGVGSDAAGYESHPDYGSSAPPGTFNNRIRDREFLTQLVRSMQDTFCIDSTRIFAAGHSNGGGFCGVIACDRELSKTFAAIAPNSGAFYSANATGTPGVTPDNVITDTPVQIRCDPGRTDMAIFETHGTAEIQIKYDGDTNHNGIIMPTIPHWLDAWAKRQGMSPNPSSTNPAAKATLMQWANPAGGELGRLQHLKLEGGEHSWPNGQGNAPINLSPYIMDFYRWPNPNNPPPTVSSTVSSTASSTSSLSASSSSSSLVYSNSSSSLVASSTSSSLTNSSSSTAPTSVSRSIFLF